MKQILAQIGTPLKEDVATIIKSRPLAKVRVEVELQKPLPKSVWIGQKCKGAGLKGYEQRLEYEGVSTFCKTCKLQGHDQSKCKVEARKNANIHKEDIEGTHKNTEASSKTLRGAKRAK